MIHSVTCYPSPGKREGLKLCHAFAEGCGGDLALPPARLREGAAAFYGMTDYLLPLWREARARGRDWYYMDNAYFG